MQHHMTHLPLTFDGEHGHPVRSVDGVPHAQIVATLGDNDIALGTIKKWCKKATLKYGHGCRQH
eukprot:1152272-Pelagomonas_calceolata.AAC.17